MTTIRHLISDIEHLRRIEGRDTPNTAEAVAYLLANAPLIEACLNWVKENTNEKIRGELQAAHPRQLDGSGISDSFWEDVPYFALWSASKYYIELTDKIKDDDLHMLKRGLEYASCCADLRQNFRLLLSPVRG